MIAQFLPQVSSMLGLQGQMSLGCCCDQWTKNVYSDFDWRVQVSRPLAFSWCLFACWSYQSKDYRFKITQLLYKYSLYYHKQICRESIMLCITSSNGTRHSTIIKKYNKPIYMKIWKVQQKIITIPHFSCCWHLCCASSSCFLVKKNNVFFRLKKLHSCDVQAQRRSVIKSALFFMNQPSMQITSDESL